MKASSKYIFVLGILTLVILGSQLLMQSTIKGSKSDSRIINISGRQRMLSQKITKASLKLEVASDKKSFDVARKELEKAFTLWKQSHEDLQYGSEEIDVGEMNASPELDKLYTDIEPFFQIIRKSASQLVALDYGGGDDEIQRLVSDISANEGAFLNLMNKITFQYDRQASAKIEQLAEVEYYLMGITFLLILLEAFFIFRPMYKDTKQKDEKLTELTELRDEEKTYASNQISLANKRIRSLRTLALDLKKQLDKRTEEANDKERAHLKQYAELAEEFEKLKTSNDIRKGRFDRLENMDEIGV